MTKERYEYICSIQEKHTEYIFSITGVQGFGVGINTLVVCFNKDAPGADITKVPEDLDGVKIEVLETGPIQLYGEVENGPEAQHN